MPCAKKIGGSQTLRTRFSSANNGGAHSIQAGIGKIPWDDRVHQRKIRILKCGDKCAYCLLSPATSKDHYIATIRKGRPSGYTSCAANMVPCCQSCNSQKGNRTLAEWRPDIASQERFQQFEIFHGQHARTFTYDEAAACAIMERVRECMYAADEELRTLGKMVTPSYLRGPPTEDIDAP